MVVAKHVELIVVGIDPEPAPVGREPSIDDRADDDASGAKPDGKRLGLAAKTRTAFDPQAHGANTLLMHRRLSTWPGQAILARNVPSGVGVPRFAGRGFSATSCAPAASSSP